MIHDVQLDYYSNKLATCSSDRTIKIYNVSENSQELVANIEGHEGPVWQVSWAHPKFGVMIASCSYDKKVMVHRESDTNRWSTVYTYASHESSVNSISWAPYEYGLILACASSDGTISIHTHQADDTWSVTKIEDSKLGCNSVSWAPFGAIGSQDEQGKPVLRIAVGSCDNCVSIYRLSEGSEWQKEAALSQHTDWVRDVAWAPITGIPTNVLATCSEDRTVYIWTQDGANAHAWRHQLLHTFDGPVWRLSWSITGNVLAVSSGDHSVTLWKETLDQKWIQVSSVVDSGQQEFKQ
jgi:protein transport protein SEC13